MIATDRLTKQREGHRVNFAWLFARARRATGLVVGLAVLAVATWIWADRLVGRPWSLGAIDRALVTPMIPLLGAILISDGLGHFDSDLERSTSIRWWLLRTIHLVVATLVVGAVLASAVLYESEIHGAYEMVRNLAGYVGIVAASAVAFGPRFAWVPATVFGAVTLLMVPKPLDDFESWWSWAWQLWPVEWARWTAVGLYVAGSALYIALGAKPTRESDIP